MERSTRGQGRNKRWRDLRLHHITSSNFGQICKATERRDLDALTTTLTTYRDLRTAAILHGRMYESVAVEKFEAKWGISTKECGLFICEEYPQLAASPDRIVDEDTILEVKCPYAHKDKAICSATVPYLKSNGGTLTLNESHNYYYQVQGQMLCSKRKRCLFVIYSFKDLVMIEIQRDDQFIKSMLDKLNFFYKSHFEPAIINKFVYKDYYRYKFT